MPSRAIGRRRIATGHADMQRDEAIRLVHSAIDAINQQLPPSRRLAKSPGTIIVGPFGSLDSLGIINFVMAIEERAGDLLGAPVQLLDDTALMETGPFRTVESLTRLLETLERR